MFFPYTQPLHSFIRIVGVDNGNGAVLTMKISSQVEQNVFQKSENQRASGFWWNQPPFPTFMHGGKKWILPEGRNVPHSYVCSNPWAFVRVTGWRKNVPTPIMHCVPCPECPFLFQEQADRMNMSHPVPPESWL